MADNLLPASDNLAKWYSLCLHKSTIDIDTVKKKCGDSGFFAGYRPLGVLELVLVGIFLFTDS